jgi:hypothetical protein
MSQLLIRTEAPPPEHFVDDWRPRSAQAPRDDGDDTPFLPLLMALEAELTRLLGLEVAVHPGRGLAPGAPDVALDLGGLLGTIRLGGDPARALPQLTGITTARHARQIGEALAPVAHRLWPSDSRRPALVVDVIVTLTGGGSVVGSIRLPAPAEPVPLVPPRALGLAGLDLPMRLAVRLADEDAPLARLLPLRPGLVIGFNICPDMPVLLGDHRVALAALSPLPDGRQQASITALDLKPEGERA